MARYDKYEPKVGGFRAPLAADFSTPLSTMRSVGLNASGQVVVGAGNTGLLGILILTKAMKAGDIVDVMTSGEIVEAGLAAGTVYYLQGDGTVATTAPAAGAAGVRAGHTVEATRLVVRVSPVSIPV